MSRFSDFFAKLFGKKAAPVAPSTPLAPPASNVVQFSPRNPAADSTASAGTSTVTGTATAGFLAPSAITVTGPGALAAAQAPAPLVPASDAALRAGGIEPVKGIQNVALAYLGAPAGTAEARDASNAALATGRVGDVAATPDQWAAGGPDWFVVLSDSNPKASFGPFHIKAGRWTLSGTGQPGSQFSEMLATVTLADGVPITSPGTPFSFVVPADTTGTITAAMTTNPKILAAIAALPGRADHRTEGVYNLLPG